MPGREWLSRQKLLVKEEFSTPWGLCDLVGVSFKRKNVRQRLSLKQYDPIGPPLRIALLNRIPDFQTGETISFRQLKREFANWISPDALERELTTLKESGFVVQSAPTRLQKLNGWVPLHRRIVALELKLLRVEEALNQARSHLRFATHSFVGLPTELAFRIVRSRRRYDFQHAGVGIIAISPASCEVLLPPCSPEPREKDVIFQMHCVERFWRTRVRDNCP